MLTQTATVEAQADPRAPGRTAYRITGKTADAVQAEIDRLTAGVDERPGFAEFYGPARVAGGYGALGHVTHQPAVSL